MQIDYDILITYGGVAKKLDKGEIVFWEGAVPLFFYQIIKGEIKLFSSNMEGKELIQGVFTDGQSFGEPPLLLEKPYPSTAQATTASVVVKISREKILHICNDFPEVSNRLLYTFAKRIYDKASSAQIWVCHTPEEKIMQFLKWKKNAEYVIEDEPVPFTRQQIADSTGIRVETVIRTLKRMHKEGKVKIVDRKLYY